MPSQVYALPSDPQLLKLIFRTRSIFRVFQFSSVGESRITGLILRDLSAVLLKFNTLKDWPKMTELGSAQKVNILTVLVFLCNLETGL